MHAGASIGTAVRVAMFGDGTGNIVLAARHCIEEGGACPHDLSTFGSALLFVAARADLDVAVFRGRRGPGLWLLQRRCCRAAGQQQAQRAHSRICVDGCNARCPVALFLESTPVSTIGASAAVVTTGMPNSSGGAVLSGSGSGGDTLLLAGTYTHRRGSGGGSSTGTSASGRSSGSGSTSPTLIERDPDALWTPGAAAFATASAARMSAPDVQSASGSRSIWGRRRAAAAAAAASAASASAGAAAAAAAAAGDVAKSAELSRLNIAHKNSMGIFTTAPALWQLLQAAGVAPPDPEQVAAADQAARRTTKRGRH
ncbi:hypothetical protein CHLRE_03g146647v5 [Chlamydomonas reinhardtii]|uniref:Uncharacterized protein n=1 Tax=Chlamydomonas reinhardtii TaxID=3055 RepID=A0A2K3DVH5_CHLRE|nr:uncharacterized protein CHLRE_03g146647v5 [Chlamydomonas reinhardtii]PNW84529.1 hypothetical protein CHLRE_03g146647v5 [Chlamydomonas reinhardtii]